jgi:hypothetical protein
MVVAVSVGCGPPDFVESVDKIDNYLAQGKVDHACVGLRMRDEVVRRGTAERLARSPSDPTAQDCLCRALTTEAEGGFDPLIAEALHGTRHAAAARCLGDALAGTGPKAAILDALVAIGAPEGFSALEKVARDEPDAALRAKALAGLQGSDTALDLAKSVLASDPDAGLRRAAVEALKGRPSAEVRQPLLLAVSGDADPGVRAAAIGAFGKATDVSVIDAVCAALLGSPDAEVRAAAATAFKGTTVARAAACLARRISAEEPDGAVREAILQAARASPSPLVTDALCDEIAPWLRKYVRDTLASEVQGYDIVEAQNNADWKRSYACVEKALRSSGLSCYARNHLAHRFRELGGQATPPWCPGMVRGTE